MFADHILVDSGDLSVMRCVAVCWTLGMAYSASFRQIQNVCFYHLTLLLVDGVMTVGWLAGWLVTANFISGLTT